MGNSYYRECAPGHFGPSAVNIELKIRRLERENGYLKKRIEVLQNYNDRLDMIRIELIDAIKELTNADYMIRLSNVYETEYDRSPVEELINGILREMELTPDNLNWTADDIAILSEVAAMKVCKSLEAKFDINELKERIYLLVNDTKIRQEAHDILLKLALKGNLSETYGITSKHVSLEKYFS